MIASALSIAAFSAAAIGLLLVGLQALALRRHLSRPRRSPRSLEGISILKPLCGVDDGLERSLELFAGLDHPLYEVLLGVRSRSDAAWPVASAAAARWPGRFRVVVQRGEPGMNPKVNQLITLARAARHDILVVSDSNVRVPRDYLRDIAARLEPEEVGLVTHPIAGVGERSLGSLLDNLHVTATISPGMVAAKRLAGRDIVVGKSMAMRRCDVEAMGGFESVKDVLAEDYVLGLKVGFELGKTVAVSELTVENVNERREVRDFLGRYTRWCVMQRKIVGPVVYGAQALLNPVALALVGAMLARDAAALALFASVCAAKATLDGASARALQGRGLDLPKLALVPVKDLLFAFAWACGLVKSTVVWRGNTLRVLAGSRLERPERDVEEGALEADPRVAL
jgi:ceramide glucosyltransferase